MYLDPCLYPKVVGTKVHALCDFNSNAHLLPPPFPILHPLSSILCPWMTNTDGWTRRIGVSISQYQLDPSKPNCIPIAYENAPSLSAHRFKYRRAVSRENIDAWVLYVPINDSPALPSCATRLQVVHTSSSLLKVPSSYATHVTHRYATHATHTRYSRDRCHTD